MKKSRVQLLYYLLYVGIAISWAVALWSMRRFAAGGMGASYNWIRLHWACLVAGGVFAGVSMQDLSALQFHFSIPRLMGCIVCIAGIVLLFPYCYRLLSFSVGSITLLMVATGMVAGAAVVHGFFHSPKHQ